MPTMIIKSIGYGEEEPSELTALIVRAIVKVRFTELGYDVVFQDATGSTT